MTAVTANATLFSTEPFLRAWLSVSHHSYTGNAAIVSLRLGESSHLYGISHPSGHGKPGTAEFGPHGLFASPAPRLPDHDELRQAIAEAHREHRIESLSWHVRFDHQALAALLRDAGFTGDSYDTHVLSLGRPYEEVFAGYSGTRRNQVRKSQRRGVTIRQAMTPQDVASYCRVHEELEAAKNFGTRYPLELIQALVELPESLLLLAEVEGRVIAGALFFLDGDSMLYWHGAADRTYSQFFAMPAVMDAGVQRACQAGMQSYNFGGSPSDSLRIFKESFGATLRQNWTFHIRQAKPPTFRDKLRGLVGGR